MNASQSAYNLCNIYICGHKLPRVRYMCFCMCKHRNNGNIFRIPRGEKMALKCTAKKE